MPARPVAARCGRLATLTLALDHSLDLGRLARRLPAAGPWVWLDSARPHAVTGRWSLLAWDPWLRLAAQAGCVTLRTSEVSRAWSAHPVQTLDSLLREYRVPRAGTPLNRAAGLLTVCSYELNRWLERLPAPRAPAQPAAPDLLAFGMRRSVLVDHLEQRAWLVSIADPGLSPRLATRQAAEALEETRALVREDPGVSAPRASADVLQPTNSRAAFHRMVRTVLEHIRAGDLYQANVSQRFTARWDGQPLALYESLRAVNPSPFACCLVTEELAVVSCSPERLVRVQGRTIDTRPIAGTRPRGATPQADALNSLDLLLSEKERAEHLMLVDLERNDLGRLCVAGSVRVDDLMALEDYSHVMHIISNISGRLRPGVGAGEILRAMFPGGTITGCPKVRCMELLRDLEPVARGFYTGSLGWMGFDGTMDLNILIRTILLGPGTLSFHVGAGIVADSEPAREYDETLAKAAALQQAIQRTSQAEAGSHATVG